MGEYEIKKGGGEKTGNQQVGRSRDRILNEAGRWMGGGGVWEKGSGSEEGKGPREKREKKAVGKMWPPAGREGWLRGRLPRERSWDSTVLDSGVAGDLSA